MRRENGRKNICECVFCLHRSLNKQKALWNIERGQHHGTLATSHLDNMMLVTALLLLGYFPLSNAYGQRQVSHNLMLTFPIVSSIASAIMSFNIMVNAVYGY